VVDDRSGALRQDPRGAAPPAAPAGALPPDAPSVNWSSWSNLWQVPAILVSLIVIAAGLYVAMKRAPKNDFDGALDQIDALLAAEKFDLAAAQLNQVVEPHLAKATTPQRARFEASVADWIALSQKSANLAVDANDRRITERYARAADLGLELDVSRIERWAEASLRLGDLESARKRLHDLDLRAASPGAGEDVHRRRHVVLRRVVEVGLRRPDVAESWLMELLDEYRADAALQAVDEAWAIARQAELRLRSGNAQEAVTRLLIDMRRFEPRLSEDGQVSLGEMYVLLASGYLALGNLAYAEHHVEQALAEVGQTDGPRAAALVIQGRIAVARGQWEEAFEFFDEVVRDHAVTPSVVPARLGRGEVYAILGDDAASIEDYRTLRAELAAGGPRRDVTPADAGWSLADRHDAALTSNRLGPALDYIALAVAFFPTNQAPPEILFRVASTSRQIADNLIAGARRADPGLSLDRIDPDVRYSAAEHYKRAGDAFLKHARSVAGRPGAEEGWADSLWLAADSFDLGGWHELAVTHFAEYLSGRSEADARRPEALFRLAQAYHADLDWNSAVKSYEQLLEQYPRSHIASRANVPLARCLLELGRKPEALRHLLEVVSGTRHLEPEARDYRDALIELGGIYYQDGDDVRAIERLDEALQRYPADERAVEVQFKLGDAHRRRAAQVEQELGSPGLEPGQRERLEQERAGHLHRAQSVFESIIALDDGTAALPVPETLLRYAYLYRAECAFSIGAYDDAASWYDRAATRFPEHHSSMTALIQIVNCYHSLGDAGRAAAAHRRALARLRSLPDEAFDAPDALMDREAWERWLDNMPLEPAAAPKG
jgi:tetratricopeptide (TPR) repeat protein